MREINKDLKLHFKKLEEKVNIVLGHTLKQKENVPVEAQK
jgi:hypothetical protein